jgi:hypothetical protein
MSPTFFHVPQALWNASQRSSPRVTEKDQVFRICPLPTKTRDVPQRRHPLPAPSPVEPTPRV